MIHIPIAELQYTSVASRASVAKAPPALAVLQKQVTIDRGRKGEKL
jgi:hypothetical protein